MEKYEHEGFCVSFGLRNYDSRDWFTWSSLILHMSRPQVLIVYGLCQTVQRSLIARMQSAAKAFVMAV
jgi:hypothetical protein